MTSTTNTTRRRPYTTVEVCGKLEEAQQRELAKARQWETDNKDAIKAYNTFVEEHGCFSDEFREF